MRLGKLAAGAVCVFAVVALLLPSELRQALAQSGFINDGTSAATPVKSASERILSRSYPSIFEAWNPAQEVNAGPATSPIAPLDSAGQLAMEARHDLVFQPFRRLGLVPKQQYPGLATEFTEPSIRRALTRRRQLLALNPNLILLSEVRYYNAPLNYLPPNSTWWKRDADGRLLQDRIQKDLFLLDYGNPELQAAVTEQCRAFLMTGVVDGCMFDWWREDDARVAMIEKVRAAIGENAILIVNSNGRRPERTAQYINGMYMEGFGSTFFADWRTAAANLLWAQSHLHPPAITALEGWYPLNSSHKGEDVSKVQAEGRSDHAMMREITTLSLTHSNGYVLFGDPNSLPTPDHLHDWYSFWDKTLGRPTGPLAAAGPSGSFRRDFERGTVIFNPPSNQPIEIKFPEQRMSEATGKLVLTRTINGGDGDIFLTSH